MKKSYSLSMSSSAAAAILASLALGLSAQALSAQAFAIETINFTAAEGYVDGSLNGQNGWVNAAPWTVDATAGTATSTGTWTQSRVAAGGTLGLGIGESATLRYVFQLAGTLTNTAGLAGKQIIEFGIGSNTTANGSNPDGFAAQLYLNGSNLSLLDRSFANGANLAIAGNGNSRIAVDMTYARTGATTSDFSWQMTNLDTSTVSNVGTTSLGADYTALITTLDPVPTFVQPFTFVANTGVTSITLHSVDVVAVPEPGSMALLLSGGVAVFAMFRRRRVA